MILKIMICILICVVQGQENKPLILVVAYGRSGSSYTAELLKFPGSMYVFEPLHYLMNMPNSPEKDLMKKLTVEGLVYCDFEYVINELKWRDLAFSLGRTNGEDFLGQNWFWSVSEHDSAEQAKILTKKCDESTGLIIKTIRMNMKMIGEIFESIADKSNVKVLFNVRDPRAMLNSWISVGWCDSMIDKIKCDNLCIKMRQDLEIFNSLKLKYPENFFFQRYEDLVSDPLPGGLQLYQQLGLNFTGHTFEFIQSHTTRLVDTAMSTYKFPNVAMTHWIKDMDIKKIRQIEKQCSRFFAMSGYTNL